VSVVETVPPLRAREAHDRAIRRSESQSQWLDRLGRALDPLPWPVGENLLAGLGLLQVVIRPDRFLRALTWAAAQPPGPHGRLSLALRLLANHGRFVAQQRLVGLRDPATLRERVRVTGEEHLVAAVAGAGTMLLGFHVGPPCSSLALQLLGYPVRTIDDLIYCPREGLEPDRLAEWRSPMPMDRKESRAVALHEARRHLAGQGLVHVLATGRWGAEAFRIALPGGPVIIRNGWLALRRLTGATTLPLLAHDEGRRRVITIHPPLPPVSADPQADREACRPVLTDVLRSYFRRFPEQCRVPLWRP